MPSPWTTSATLVTYVRVVELPGDPFTVHLAVEVSRAGLPVGNRPDYRAPTTVCAWTGYRQTTRDLAACPECERAYPEAAEAGLDACRRLLRAQESA